jgi:hypothetical protein
VKSSSAQISLKWLGWPSLIPTKWNSLPHSRRATGQNHMVRKCFTVEMKSLLQPHAHNCVLVFLMRSFFVLASAKRDIRPA